MKLEEKWEFFKIRYAVNEFWWSYNSFVSERFELENTNKNEVY